MYREKNNVQNALIASFGSFFFFTTQCVVLYFGLFRLLIWNYVVHCFRLPPHQFSQLMPVAFENLISISNISLPLYNVCAKHFIDSVFHRFPSNFIDGLQLSLSGMNI